MSGLDDMMHPWRCLSLILLALCVATTVAQAQPAGGLPSSREELTHFLLLAKESRQQATEELTKARGRLKFHQERYDYLSERLEQSRRNVDARTVYAGQMSQSGNHREIEDAVYLLHESEQMTLLLHGQLPPIAERVAQTRDEVDSWQDELARTTQLVTMLENALEKLPRPSADRQPEANVKHEDACPICRQRRH